MNKMVNGPFIDASARIEAAIASILEFAATTQDPEFIERITKLAIKKEIVLELLLDEIGDIEDEDECECSGTVNATAPNSNITINGAEDTGDVTFVGEVCPDCSVEGSSLTFTFTDDTPTPNNSFTLVSTSIPAPTCVIGPTGISLNISGLGVVTRADMSTVNVSFFVTLSESTTPGEADSFFISIESEEVGNPFEAVYFSPDLPDNAIVVEECD
ncbi:hypothetical protein [Oceanobacillus senegalensis]|uniref:hypothetical protein n=1 Tax=Oceanobacillus senegalensis TaxID=1936063 RepID=UPI001C4F6FF0|nr:hypothetical protein [Oceanobacillus senegalensis]